MVKALIVALIAVCVFCLMFMLGATAARAGEPLIEINNLGSEDLIVRGFDLSEKGDIEIDAVGAGGRHSKQLSAYAWIIDARDRDVVWTMQEDCEDMSRISDVLFECEDTKTLRPGKYEVYYYVGRNYQIFSGDGDISINDLGELIDFIGEMIKLDPEKAAVLSDDDLSELSLTIRTDADAETYNPVFKEPAGSIVYVNRPEKDEMHEQGFTLPKKTDLKIYAIGEYSESYDLFVDGAWIINGDTHERVWQMDKWNTERAGGSSKNRYFRDVVTLPAGNYIAYYGTDDSHDFGEWNAPPPADPMNYGISIATADPQDKKQVKPFNTKLTETEIVDLTRMRDYEFNKAGFSLKKDSKIHIVALGERGYGNKELVDYGWISDADNLEKVWEMTPDNTGFAGGAAKNARFDGIIDLPAGNYIVSYRTDDSHSYRDWNAAPPIDKSGWGIRVYGVGRDFTPNSFKLIDKFQPLGSVLVNLTGLGDDENVKQVFTLNELTKIRVTALGEGKSGKMFDYGWIENNDNGEIVWEMTYRKTRSAGGADKNRIVVANLALEKGEYTAHFVTDDSHSFEHFNASPPDNPEQWGMLITQR
jgi:hypothetical protein